MARKGSNEGSTTCIGHAGNGPPEAAAGSVRRRAGVHAGTGTLHPHSGPPSLRVLRCVQRFRKATRRCANALGPVPKGALRCSSMVPIAGRRREAVGSVTVRRLERDVSVASSGPSIPARSAGRSRVELRGSRRRVRDHDGSRRGRQPRAGGQSCEQSRAGEESCSEKETSSTSGESETGAQNRSETSTWERNTDAIRASRSRAVNPVGSRWCAGRATG